MRPAHQSCLSPGILSAWQSASFLEGPSQFPEEGPLGGLGQFPRRRLLEGGATLDHSDLCLHQGHSNGNRRYESDEDSLGSSGRVMHTPGILIVAAACLFRALFLCLPLHVTSFLPALAIHTSPKRRFCKGANPFGKCFSSSCPGWGAEGLAGRIRGD